MTELLAVPVDFPESFSMTGMLDGRTVVVTASDGVMLIDSDVAQRARQPRPGPDTYPVVATIGRSCVGTVLALMRSLDSVVSIALGGASASATLLDTAPASRGA